MRRSPLAVLLLMLAATPAAAAPGAPARHVITRAALMRTVERLAAPEARGRLAGSPEYARVARAMAQEFRNARLRPGGADGFLQPVTVEYNPIGAAWMTIGREGAPPSRLRLGPDFAVRGLSGAGRVDAPVVFAGYGIAWPEGGYDDYAGLDVRGKVVLAFKEAPPFTPPAGAWGPRALPRPRGRMAAERGAAALLLVSRPLQEHPQAPIASMLEGPGPQAGVPPMLQVSVAVGESLAAASGLDLRALQAAIDSTHAPRPVALDARVRLGVDARHEPRATSYNVIGVLDGMDPALRAECVVIGAHLDHVGAQGDSVVWRGANDNASGAAAVLQIARAFAAGPRPRRTVVFVLFTSEEAGLQGSKAFVERPPVPRERIVAYLNLDCVGVGDSLQVGGGMTWTRMWALARAADAAESRRLIAATWPGGGADAAPFSDAGIPIAYFASNPSYAHLHRTSDTPETLAPDLLEAIARTAYRTAWAIAQGAGTHEPGPPTRAAGGHE